MLRKSTIEKFVQITIRALIIIRVRLCSLGIRVQIYVFECMLSLACLWQVAVVFQFINIVIRLLHIANSKLHGVGPENRKDGGINEKY